MSIERKMPPPPWRLATRGAEGPLRARARGHHRKAVLVAAVAVIVVLEHYSPPICVSGGLLGAGLQYLSWERRWRDLVLLLGIALIPSIPSLVHLVGL